MASDIMKSIVISMLTVVALLAVLLCRLIWIPDILTGKRVAVATATNSSGDSIEILQYWNEDLYCCLLRHKSPLGVVHSVVLDPDGFKLWRCAIVFETNSSAVTVRTGQKKLGRYDLSSDELTRPNGVIVRADGVKTLKKPGEK
jgi:hypothetical protein